MYKVPSVDLSLVRSAGDIVTLAVRGATLYTGKLGTFAVNGVLLTADNYDEMTDGFAISSTTGGGGGGGSTAWADVTGKPFTAIGTGLTVTDGALSSDGSAPAWGLVTGKPFETVGAHLRVDGGELATDGVAVLTYNNDFTGLNVFRGQFGVPADATFTGNIHMFGDETRKINIYGVDSITASATYTVDGNKEFTTKEYVDAAISGGGTAPTWDMVQNKPFEGIGDHLTVGTDNKLMTTGVAYINQDNVYSSFNDFRNILSSSGTLNATGYIFLHPVLHNALQIGEKNNPDSRIEIYNVDSLTASPTHIVDDPYDFTTKRYVDSVSAGSGVAPAWSAVTGKPFESVGNFLKVDAGNLTVTGLPTLGGYNMWTTGSNNQFGGISVFMGQTMLVGPTLIGDRLYSGNRVEIFNVDSLTASPTHVINSPDDFTTKAYVDSVSAGVGVAPAWSAVTGKPFEAVGVGLSVGSDKKLNANAQGWNDITGKPFTGVGANLTVTGNNLTTGDNVPLKDGGNTWTGSNTFSGLYASGSTVITGNIVLRPDVGKRVEITNVDTLRATADHKIEDGLDFTTKAYVDSVSAGAGVAPAWSAVTGKPFEAVGSGLSVGSDKKLNANAQAWNDITGKPFESIGANLKVGTDKKLTTDNVALTQSENTFSAANTFYGQVNARNGLLIAPTTDAAQVYFYGIDTMRASATYRHLVSNDFATKGYVDGAVSGMTPTWDKVTGKPFEGIGNYLTVDHDKKLTVGALAKTDAPNIFTKEVFVQTADFSVNGTPLLSAEMRAGENSNFNAYGNVQIGSGGTTDKKIQIYNVDTLTASPTYVIGNPNDITTKSYVDNVVNGSKWYSMSTITPVDSIHDGDTVVFPLAQFHDWNVPLKDASVSWRIRFGIYNGKIHYNNFNRSVHEVYEVEGGSMTGDWNWMYPAKYVGGYHPNSGTPKLLGVYQHASGDPVYAIYQWYGSQQYPENNLSQPIVVVEGADLWIHTNGGKNTNPDGIRYFNNQPLQTLAGLLKSYKGTQWCTSGFPQSQAAILRWFEPVQEEHPMLAYTTNPNNQQSSENGIVYARLGSWSPYDPTTNNSVNLALDFSIIPSQTHTGTYFQREDYRLYISHNNQDFNAKYASVYYVGSSGSSAAVDSVYLVKAPTAGTYDIWVGYYSHYRSQPIAIVTSFDQLVTPNPNGHRINRNTFESAKLEPVVKAASVLKRAYGGDTTLVAFVLKDFAGEDKYAKLGEDNTFTGNNTFKDIDARTVGISHELYASGNVTLDGDIQLGTNATQDVFINSPAVMYPGYLTGTPHPTGWGSVEGTKFATGRELGDTPTLPTVWTNVSNIPSAIDVSTIVSGRLYAYALSTDKKSIYQTADPSTGWVQIVTSSNVIQFTCDRSDTVTYVQGGEAYMLKPDGIIRKIVAISGYSALSTFYSLDMDTIYGLYRLTSQNGFSVLSCAPGSSTWQVYDDFVTQDDYTNGRIVFFRYSTAPYMSKQVLLYNDDYAAAAYHRRTAGTINTWALGRYGKNDSQYNLIKYSVNTHPTLCKAGIPSDTYACGWAFFNSFDNPASNTVEFAYQDVSLNILSTNPTFHGVIANYGDYFVSANSYRPTRVMLFNPSFGPPIDDYIVSSAGLKHVFVINGTIYCVDNNNSVYKGGSEEPPIPPDPPTPPSPPGIIDTNKPFIQGAPNQYVATVGYADNWQTATRTIRIPHVDNTSKNTEVSHGAHFSSWQRGWDVWAQYWIPDSTLIYCYPNDGWEVSDWIVNGTSTGQAGNTILVAIHNDATIRPVVTQKPPNHYAIAVSPPTAGTLTFTQGGTSVDTTRWYRGYFNCTLGQDEEINSWKCNGYDVSMMVQYIQQPYDYLFDTDGDATLTLITDNAPQYEFDLNNTPLGCAYPTINGHSEGTIVETNTTVVLNANVQKGYVFSHWELNGDRIDGGANTTYYVNEEWSPHGGIFTVVCVPDDNYILLRWGNDAAKEHLDVYVDDVNIKNYLDYNSYLIERMPNHIVKIDYHCDARPDYYPLDMSVGGVNLQRQNNLYVGTNRFNSTDTSISSDGVIVLTEAPTHDGLGPNTWRRCKVYMSNVCTDSQDEELSIINKLYFTKFNILWYDVGEWFDLPNLSCEVKVTINNFYIMYDTHDSSYRLEYCCAGEPDQIFNHTYIEPFVNNVPVYNQWHTPPRMPCCDEVIVDGVTPASGICEISFTLSHDGWLKSTK
jgi:hypothetical protein